MEEILGQEKTHQLLEVAVTEDMPVLLVGDTGSGKTSIVRNLAKKHGKEFSRFNLTGETTVDEFVGKFILKNEETIWQDGLLVTAMKQGHWLVVDEVNVALPEILFVLHSLLDDDRFIVVAGDKGEIVRPHKDFRFFATMNPVDEYAGTKELNKAFKSRFNMIINMDYPTRSIETQVIRERCNVENDIASKIVDVGVKIRQEKNKGNVFYTCSTRDLIQWGKLTKLLNLRDAFTVTVLNKANGDGKKLEEIYSKTIEEYGQIMSRGIETNVEWYKTAYELLKEKEEELSGTEVGIIEKMIKKLKDKKDTSFLEKVFKVREKLAKDLQQQKTVATKGVAPKEVPGEEPEADDIVF